MDSLIKWYLFGWPGTDDWFQLFISHQKKKPIKHNLYGNDFNSFSTVFGQTIREEDSGHLDWDWVSWQPAIHHLCLILAIITRISCRPISTYQHNNLYIGIQWGNFFSSNRPLIAINHPNNPWNAYSKVFLCPSWGHKQYKKQSYWIHYINILNIIRSHNIWILIVRELRDHLRRDNNKIT